MAGVNYGDTVDNEELGRPVTDFRSFVWTAKGPPSTAAKWTRPATCSPSLRVLCGHPGPKLENNAVTFYQRMAAPICRGTVYDEDGSLALRGGPTPR